MKHSDPHNQKIDLKIKQTLDNEELDKDTRQQLANARYQVLQEFLTPRRSRFTGPVAAFASVCIIAIAIIVSLNSNNQPSELDDIEVFDIITRSDSLEMYENLEFYLWMDEEVKT